MRVGVLLARARVVGGSLLCVLVAKHRHTHVEKRSRPRVLGAVMVVGKRGKADRTRNGKLNNDMARQRRRSESKFFLDTMAMLLPKKIMMMMMILINI